ncbi:type I-F CRISPR-associated protein Csy3 [Methylotuvimicrobium sp.]|uniref:type I-F CRISPR-associated protein Csy3 n=1 Tax=Methylotuvimicrobium sp. TaxID=2822413 RepID=UPI003D655428
MTEIKLPSLLSFERKLEPSDALMFAGCWNEPIENDEPKQGKKDHWQPIRITKRLNRSTQSAHGTKPDDMSKPNPVASDNDDANLPHDKDTLKVSFTLRIVGNIGKPYACNDPAFEKLILEKVKAFREASNDFSALAFRYAYNIANGRFLWRNRVCAEQIIVNASFKGLEKPITFNAYDYSLNDFDKNKDCEKLQTLSNKIKEGFGNNGNFVLLEIDAYVKLGNGQHVFPSQEMNMGEKKKVLFQLEDTAAIHNVKIGNALRTVDDWYENAEFPIAAEPFGAVTQRGEAHRKSKIDLYTLMLDWLNKDSIEENQKNYVVANLIRGGVFSRESEKGS